jgi:hypothetical protein
MFTVKTHSYPEYTYPEFDNMPRISSSDIVEITFNNFCLVFYFYVPSLWSFFFKINLTDLGRIYLSFPTMDVGFYPVPKYKNTYSDDYETTNY